MRYENCVKTGSSAFGNSCRKVAHGSSRKDGYVSESARSGPHSFWTHDVGQDYCYDGLEMNMPYINNIYKELALHLQFYLFQRMAIALII